MKNINFSIKKNLEVLFCLGLCLLKINNQRCKINKIKTVLRRGNYSFNFQKPTNVGLQKSAQFFNF